jgi:hypothetical protein
MAVNVNPPPFLRLPPEFLKDRQTRAFIEQQNIIIFQLWNRLGGSNDIVSDLEVFISSSESLTQWAQKNIEGLPEFTVDTTGFTSDTTLITTDKLLSQPGLGASGNDEEVYNAIAANALAIESNALVIASNTLAIASNALAITTVIPQVGGGGLTALRVNELQDSGAYTLPLANTVLVNQTITITLPSRYGASTPTVTASGSDSITDIDGADTNIIFAGATKLSLTSDGVSNWNL